jgi:hypothetical protein
MINKIILCFKVLMVFKDMIAVYSEVRMKQIRSVGKNVDALQRFLILDQVAWRPSL